jgi:serine/threonine protein kinase
MAMGPQRWSVIAESRFAWEREALEFLREHLPDRDPWHAWSNFEFIDDEGKVNEVDALVLSPQGLFLIEIKSRPGILDGDAHTWTWTTDGRRYSDDNPLILANRKAKRLASLLKRQPSVVKGRGRVPFIEAVIFLSASRLAWTVDGATRTRTFDRGRPGHEPGGIIGALMDGLSVGPSRHPVDGALTRVVCRAISECGIRPSLRDRRIGDYELKRIIADGDGWQDWEGRHVSLGLPRRIRIHPFAATTTDEARRSQARLAAREFQILEGIDHPGILKVREFKETDRGPALVFDHDPNARRLDFMLREHLELMGADLRLHFVRQLAETLKYAHEKRLYHRALSPQSILVREIDKAFPRLQIMDWQTASRDAAAGSTVQRTSGTEHLENYVEDFAKVYLAPEVLCGGSGTGPHHDIFSLGAIAFHLFAGRAPASSPLDLVTRLRAGGGLLITDAIDGAGQSLVDLIRLSTHPDVSHRIDSMDEFLEYLAEAERELRRGAAEATVDPAVAKADDLIDGGFVVVRRLGRGASADVLLVRAGDDTEELVLKVALDPANSDRLRSEGAVLATLHHTNIVKCRRTVTVAGRTAILMERAGEHTLAHHIRSEERLSLDLIKRFGEELLDAVDYLETEGIAHRDIKPDNIGIAAAGHSGKKRLVLFDFSLARTPPDSIHAGTRPYLDPFLCLRKPPRWDLHAERFAVAVTLYEMLTGTVPVWGDERSDPSLIDQEATVEGDRFDPNLRDGLAAFFSRALRRDYRERFGNAEDMRRAWRQIFDVPIPATDEDGFDAIVRRATSTTSIADLGYGVEAQDVLDRMGVHTVRDLLAVPRHTLRYLTGVGDRIRREIRLKAKRIVELRGDLRPGTAAPSDAGLAIAGQASIDRLTELLILRRPLGEEVAEDRVLAVYLGIEATDPPRNWPTVGQVGTQCGMARTAVTAVLARGRERWLKQPLLTEVRAAIEVMLKANAGVMAVTELARQVLALRGSTQAEEADRLRFAGAVVRAATDAEGTLEKPRFEAFEDDTTPLVAISVEAAIQAQALGRKADDLAKEDPLATPQRALAELEALKWPSEMAPPTQTRLLTLAVAASSSAALSSRQEIYPQGMPAGRALKMALGSLLGPRFLKEEQVRDRVRGRYPEAAALPPRPALDALLAGVGAGRVWADGDDGPGYYADRASSDASSGRSSVHRYKTDGPPVDQTPDVVLAQRLEEKLAYADRTGGFMALTVEPRLYLDAGRALLGRFPRRRVSFDALMLKALRAASDTRKVDWSLVLRADAADRHSRDWTNLQRLVSLAAPKVVQDILGAAMPLLLVDVGLLGRYDLMARVQNLRDSSGTAGGPPGLWLLLPHADGGLPMIDDKAVPVIDSSQWARLTRTWIANAHRAGVMAAG